MLQGFDQKDKRGAGDASCQNRARLNEGSSAAEGLVFCSDKPLNSTLLQTSKAFF